MAVFQIVARPGDSLQSYSFRIHSMPVLMKNDVGVIDIDWLSCESGNFVDYLLCGPAGAELTFWIFCDKKLVLSKSRTKEGEEPEAFHDDFPGDRQIEESGERPRSAEVDLADFARRKSAMADEANTVELVVKVSDRNGIEAYGFAYDGIGVRMNHGQGTFRAIKNQTKLLEWVMEGNPGGTMKVVVQRGNATLYTRERSEIVPPFVQAVDAFEINVS